jgi:hypothetical protein
VSPLSARRSSSSQVSQRRLALGSPVLVAAVSWQPLALMVDTMMMWPNFAKGWLSHVALVACMAGSCVMITTVVSGHKPAVTRRFAIAQYRIAAVFAAVSLVMFFAAGQYPPEYLQHNLASSWLLLVLLYVPLALTLVSWGGHALFEPLSSTPAGKSVAKAGRVVIGCRGGVEMTVSRLRRFRSPCVARTLAAIGNCAMARQQRRAEEDARHQ